MRRVESPFADPDREGDHQRLINYLDVAHRLPELRAAREAAYDSLSLSPGSKVLDIGCGLGDGAAAVSRRVEPTGYVIGVDKSWRFAALAQRRHPQPSVRFVQGVGQRLPVKNGAFDAAIIERTLQHIDDPIPVMDEMKRALRIGGRAFVLEPDWTHLSISHPDEALNRRVLSAFTAAFACGGVGGQLRELMRRSGFRPVESHRLRLVRRSRLEAGDFLSLTRMQEIALSAGLAQPDVDAWREGLPLLNFVAALPLCWVVGET